MHGIFTNICPKNHPNVRKYTSTMEHMGITGYQTVMSHWWSRGCFFLDLPLGAPSGALCGDVQMSRAVAREKSGRRAMWEKMAAINLKFGDD